MSERRRVAARSSPPQAPSDQRVWGPPQDGSYDGAFEPPRGRRGAPAPAGYADMPVATAPAGYAEMPGRRGGQRPPRDDYPPEAYDEGRRRGGRRAEPSGPPEPLHEEEPPRRRGRRRGGDEETGYSPAPTAPTAPSRASRGGGDLPPPDGRPSRRRGGGGGRRSGLGIGGWISVVLTCVLVIGTLTAYKVYRSTIGLINRGASTDDLDKNRPVNETGAINVLLVGSDTRAGDNKKYGQHLVNDGERTDTIMLLHVSPNRDGATLLSFPRDSMVMIPACYNRNRTLVPAHLGMINSAFSDGGMICTRRTIESLTGIRVHHYVKVDFTGFKSIVNALGGIEICLPQDVNDKQSKLTLAKGKHLVKGETALAYVRLRHGLGDGSDISRIKRQQVFLSQVVKKATSSALLTDVGKLQNFIAAAAKSVTMDDALNTEELIKIAQSAQKLSAKGFKATTVPWEPYIADKNRVQWKQPAAGNLFKAIANDTEVAPTASAAPSAAASPSGPVVTKPQQVKVQVFNGTNTPGRGKEVAEELSGLGFNVVGVGDARKPDGTDQPKTVVRYTGQGWNYSKILVGKLINPVSPETGKVASGPVTPFTPSSPSPDAPKGKVRGPIIQLVIGADWKGVRVPLQVGDNAVTSETNICAS
ncbi:LCP family protein [Microbispora catharanthi]|uniref:LytR family transcriptional regulator n=1 Tax=Microbispora catharanthi TaxID=1712871 RepID=A0A5N6C118_9ACTN|nr:LCP family protein [Microbispora catharanthi]KAB8186454.1 LytR family transcriptional regulator [Microbispora catharanthi]